MAQKNLRACFRALIVFFLLTAGTVHAAPTAGESTGLLAALVEWFYGGFMPGGVAAEAGDDEIHGGVIPSCATAEAEAPGDVSEIHGGIMPNG